MELIYRHGPSTAAEVREQAPAPTGLDRKLAAIAALLREKGLITVAATARDDEPGTPGSRDRFRA